MDFDKWEENIRVIIRNMRAEIETYSEKDCLDKELSGNQIFRGNCERCKWWMGMDTSKAKTAVFIGDVFWGCCWLKIKENAKI